MSSLSRGFESGFARMAASRGRSHPLSATLVPLGLFVLALAVRALPWRTTFADGRVYLSGSDAYYHARRILYALVHRFEILEFDPYVNFPAGGEPIWPPYFDGAIARLVSPFVQGDDAAALERIIVWLPPLLGAATVVVLYRLVLRHFGPAAALAAALLLAILPAHFWYSQLGFVDHHAATALVTTGLLASAMGFLQRSSGDVGLGRENWQAASATGLLLAGSLLLWPGSLIHVGVVQSALLLFLLTRSRRTQAVHTALLLTAMGVVAFLCVLPGTVGRSWIQWGALSPVVLSSFQPWMFGFASIFCGLCALLWRRSRWGATRTRRLTSALALAALLALASGVLFPGLIAGCLDAWRWFAKDEAFQASVSESAPLLQADGAFSLASAMRLLSPLSLLFPVLLVGGGWMARRREAPAPIFLCLWWSGVLGVATAVQMRFMNSFSVALALLVGWLLLELAGRAGVCSGNRRGRWAVLALAVLLIAPALSSYRLHAVNQVAFLRGEAPTLTTRHLMQRSLGRVGGWFRRHTPETRGYLAAWERPAWGILAAWQDGHVLRYTARRPLVQDNFGDDVGATNFALVHEFLRGRAEQADAILSRLAVRYLVLRPQMAGRRVPGSIYRRLRYHDGKEVALETAEGTQRLPALTRFRLVHESEYVTDTAQPTFKVFEYVEGARLTGRTRPGGVVTARLPIETTQHRTFWYRATAEADQRGRYSFRLPYATAGASEGEPVSVRTGAYYTLACGSVSARVVVEERQVRGGDEVAGPDLCL